jgi:hypothetical protein
VSVSLGARGGAEADLLATQVSDTKGRELPFVVFVAELPAAADLCAATIVRARSADWESLGSARVRDWDRAWPSAPVALAGSERCRMRTLGPATAQVAATLRSLARGLALT